MSSSLPLILLICKMQISHEFGLVCDRMKIMEDFNKAWKKNVFKALAYAFSHSSPTKDLKNALQGLTDDDMDDLKVGEYSDIKPRSRLERAKARSKTNYVTHLRMWVGTRLNPD